MFFENIFSGYCQEKQSPSYVSESGSTIRLEVDSSDFYSYFFHWLLEKGNLLPVWYLAILFYIVMKSCLDQEEQWAVLKKVMSDLSATMQRLKFQVEISSSVRVIPADVGMMTDAHLQL